MPIEAPQGRKVIAQGIALAIKAPKGRKAIAQGNALGNDGRAGKP